MTYTNKGGPLTLERPACRVLRTRSFRCTSGYSLGWLNLGAYHGVIRHYGMNHPMVCVNRVIFGVAWYHTMVDLAGR